MVKNRTSLNNEKQVYKLGKEKESKKKLKEKKTISEKMGSVKEVILNLNTPLGIPSRVEQ